MGAAGRLVAVEGVEDPLALAGRKARARDSHRHAGRFVRRRQRDRDLAIRLAHLERVVEHVHQHLLQPQRIA